MTQRDDELDAELFAALVDALPAESVAPSLKDRLMKSVDATAAAEGGRFERFVEQVMQMCDMARDKASDMLRALDDATRWIGGQGENALFHVDNGGPKVAGALIGFVRIQAGGTFPLHEHVGDEVVLVLQGSYRDSLGNVHHAGDQVFMKAGTTHELHALPGPDLMYLGVIQGGMRIDGNLVEPSDPSY